MPLQHAPAFHSHLPQESSPLDDIFIHSEKNVWPSAKHEPSTILANCPTFGDIPFLDEPIKSTFNPADTPFSDSLPILRHLPVTKHPDVFSSVQDIDIECNEGLSTESIGLENESVSDKTEFSGYLSEERTDTDANVLFDNVSFAQNMRSLPNTIMDNSKPQNIPIPCDPFFRKEVQKPPTTAGIGLEDLKAVFHLERPKAEKKLGLKRTTFSNLSRHYGISKWPFRTIRDALNRMDANNRLLSNTSLSRERRRKLNRQQKLLQDVIKLIYLDPTQSRDSNTLAVLLMIVAGNEKVIELRNNKIQTI